MAARGTVDRPDLEEFLSALSGFVDKTSESPDSSAVKFLDIFCRSVGSGEGHLLRPDGDGRLASVASFGMEPRFSEDFNKSRGRGDSPLDAAFAGRRVEAVVEIKESDVPVWFHGLMDRHGYKSLVAVPIIGEEGPTGLLCAYYRDVCLFDQGTLDRLLSVGRMLGGAEGASGKSLGGTPAGDGGDGFDGFAESLTEKSFSKIQVFQHLVATVAGAYDGASVFCGPVRMVSGEMVITVADGEGVPSSAVSRRFTMPAALRQKLVTGHGPDTFPAQGLDDFRTLVKSPKVAVACRPLMWQGKMQAALFVFRPAAERFTDGDLKRLGKLAAIAALALNAA